MLIAKKMSKMTFFYLDYESKNNHIWSHYFPSSSNLETLKKLQKFEFESDFNFLVD